MNYPWDVCLAPFRLSAGLKAMNLIITTSSAALSPNYVLLNGKTRLSPAVLPLRSGKLCSSLYGFSDKAPYDLFRGNSILPLTPFPLVKVYLRTLLEASPENLQLVILDAAGPAESTLRAATMLTVLEAQIAQSTSLLAEYTLTFDNNANGYRVDEV